MELGPAQTLKLFAGFRCFAPKRSPLLQILNVVAAILRAKVLTQSNVSPIGSCPKVSFTALPFAIA